MSRSPATPQQRAVVNACLSKGIEVFWRSQGTLLVERSGIAEILPEVLESGAVLLGFEGFEMESTVIHPRIDLIFVSENWPANTDPISAVADWGDDIWVDIALA